MSEFLKALKRERITNIKELQRSPSQALRGVTRILRGSQTLGYFLDAATFDEFVEDLEALGSREYLASIRVARRERRAPVSLADVKRRYHR